MAQTETVETTQIDWKVITNLAIIVAALGAAAYAVWQFIDALLCADKEAGDFGQNVDPWLFWGSLSVAVCFGIRHASAHDQWTGSKLYQKVVAPLDRLERLTRGYVFSFTASIVFVLMIPIVGFMIMSMTPYRVATPQGSVRVWDSGRVSAPGAMDTSRRYIVRGVLVPLDEPMTVKYPVTLTSGASVTVLIALEHRLAVGEPLIRLLSAHANSLGRNRGSDVQFDGRSRMIIDATDTYLNPNLVRLVHEIEGRQLVGTGVDMRVRLGRLLDADRARMPAWERDVSVTDIDIPELTLSH